MEAVSTQVKFLRSLLIGQIFPHSIHHADTTVIKRRPDMNVLDHRRLGVFTRVRRHCQTQIQTFLILDATTSISARLRVIMCDPLKSTRHHTNRRKCEDRPILFRYSAKTNNRASQLINHASQTLMRVYIDHFFIVVNRIYLCINTCTVFFITRTPDREVNSVQYMYSVLTRAIGAHLSAASSASRWLPSYSSRNLRATSDQSIDKVINSALIVPVSSSHQCTTYDLNTYTGNYQHVNV